MAFLDCARGHRIDLASVDAEVIGVMDGGLGAARRETPKDLALGVDCAGALPTYTAEPSSPTKLQHGIWTLSLPSTTRLPSTNCSSDWNNHGNGAAVGCVPSVP